MLLSDRIQHVTGARDMGEINFGFDLIGCRTTGTSGFWRGVLSFRGPQISTHLLGFMLFERTGMRLFLGDSNVRQCIENSFTFDFQLSCQIVDSNLTHPPRFPPSFPLRFHTNLTVVDDFLSAETTFTL